jgi:hypothetical protein
MMRSTIAWRTAGKLGFLAPLLVQSFGFRDFLQRSDMGFKSAAFVRFRPLARRMGGLLSY